MRCVRPVFRRGELNVSSRTGHCNCEGSTSEDEKHSRSVSDDECLHKKDVGERSSHCFVLRKGALLEMEPCGRNRAAKSGMRSGTLRWLA